MNKILKDKLGVTHDVPAVFIDSWYDNTSSVEAAKFNSYANTLLEFAKTNDPFECKNITVAKYEIRELYDKLKKA